MYATQFERPNVTATGNSNLANRIFKPPAACYYSSWTGLVFVQQWFS
jgi:hypothetical protein